jgi:uncharacterized RDD family membrane protein YckC
MSQPTSGKPPDENWADDQQKRGYYYDDAYGYEAFKDDDNDERGDDDAPDTPIYATIFQRVAAYALDVVILFTAVPLVLGSVFAAILYLTIGFGWMGSGYLFWLFVFCTVSLPVWLYYSAMESSKRQATLGMRLFGIRVTDTDGDRIAFGRALLRTVVKLLPFELNHMVMFIPEPIWSDPDPGFRLGFVAVNALMIVYVVTMLLNSRSQSVHDLIARTIVVKN